MKKDGFVSMTLVYTFLILFLFLMLAVLSAYTQQNKFISAINQKIDLTINTPDKYDHCYYSGGQEWTFDYTGNEQIFIAECTGYYQIELWGAQGGKGNGINIGGKGAYTSGEIRLEKGTQLHVYVGQSPTVSTTTCSSNLETNETINNAAFNGNMVGSCSGGGGATDVRLEGGQWSYPKSLRSRIMVAAGGGGAYYSGSGYTGGDAGGIIGYSGVGGSEPGLGGYQTSTSYGMGANGYSSGGGGYYGGAGGGTSSNGGGGSSYISGHKGCVASASDLTTTPRLDSTNNTVCSEPTTDIVCSYHYSDLVFRNTKMIDGKGKIWTTSAGNVVNMPTHDGTGIMTGNSGNGYAKITFISE